MVSITHAFTNPKSDGGDATIVRPSDWNADHVVEGLVGSAFVGVKAYLSGNQTVTANTETSLAFNGEDYDTDGFHDTVTNNTRITIPAGLGGKYLFYAELDLSSTPGSCYLQFRVNGSTYGRAVNYGGTWASSTRGSLRITETLDLVAGDYVEVRGLRTTGTVFVGSSSFVQAHKLDSGALGGSPGARAFHNTTQGSLGSGAVNALSLNTEDWDTDGFHDTVTNNSRFTIPAGLGGKYLLIGHSSVDQAWQPYWKKNGSTFLGATFQSAATGQGATAVLEDLAAGDYVEFCEYHASGTATAGNASARHIQTEASIIRIGGQQQTGQGTAFPSGPATNTRYFRTDLGMEFYYDGTRWLSSELFGATAQGFAITAVSSENARIGGPGMADAADIWLVAANLWVGVFGTNNGSNYWTYTIDKRASNDGATAILTANTSAVTASTWTRVNTAIGASCTMTGALNFVIQATVKTGTPANLQIGGGFTYRLIGT